MLMETGMKVIIRMIKERGKEYSIGLMVLKKIKNENKIYI